MLYAIRNELGRRYPTARVVMAPSRSSASQPLARIRENGMLAKSAFWRGGVQWGDLATVLPARVRAKSGLILDRELDAVFDAAGFGYGSPWPDRHLAELAHAAKRWKRRSTALVMLPQAFGVFTSPEARQSIRTVADSAQLMYARDPESLENLREVLGDHPALRLAPDFTSLLAAHLPDEDLAERLHHIIAVVPNARMLDKTAELARAAYLPFLDTCMGLLRHRGLKVALVIHGGAEDLALAQQLQQIHPNAELLLEADPLRLKGLLGACRGSIGSRYHGLINCLSQGVPAFGTSWSHKYRALYGQYDFTEGLVESLSGADAERVCTLLSDDEWMATRRVQLMQSAENLKAASRAMWEEVFAVVETTRSTEVVG